MPMYMFNVCNPDGLAISFEVFELPYDGNAFVKAGQLLNEHTSCAYVEVWEGDRSVLACHRDQPVIRPIEPCDDPGRFLPAPSTGGVHLPGDRRPTSSLGVGDDGPLSTQRSPAGLWSKRRTTIAGSIDLGLACGARRSL